MLATAKARRLNPQKYGELLLSALPRAIRTEAEYDRIAEIVTGLALKGEGNLTPEEDALLELLTLLIERYDDEHYRIPDAPPHAVIQMLMRDRGFRHKDLITVLGSRGGASDVINGRRKPSKTQIKSLADFFQVSPEVFISLD